jgi:adenylate cyclase
LLAGASLALLTHGVIELSDGVLYDASLAINPLRPGHGESRVVVIAVDQGSLSSPLLATVPRVYLGPFFAKLLRGLFNGGARVVGIDIVFSYSASRFGPDPNYDKPFLEALAAYRDRVVLARTTYTRVADPIVAALFDPDRDGGREEPRAIAYSELAESEDGIQRLVLPTFSANDGTLLPAFAERLVQTAGEATHTAPVLLAPEFRIESMPTYAFADVLRCIETSPEKIRAVFSNKIVVIGSNLVEEDRKRGPDRFLRWPAKPRSDAETSECKLEVLGPSDRAGSTVSGLHIHAAAVAGLITGNLVAPAPFAGRLAASTAAATAGGALALVLSPVFALGAMVLGVMLIFALSTLGLGSGVWLPASVPSLALVVAIIGGQVARFFVEERRRKRVERAFGHYLAPAIVDQLAQADDQLHLGGELREVTVMFADLSNFTSIADTMDPKKLMELTNGYFEVIVGAIEETGGYVDKFVGDSVMALWGAPVAGADSSVQAVASAFLIQEKTDALRRRDAQDGIAGFAVKVGISTGRAIVGNAGASHRFNYTALGGTVNVASRLEKVCAQYACNIALDAATAAKVKDRYLVCELDSVSLRGIHEAISVYQPIGELAAVSSGQHDEVARYQAALHLYREGNLDGAAMGWADICVTATDEKIRSPARVMAGRAAQDSSARATAGTGESQQ